MKLINSSLVRVEDRRLTNQTGAGARKRICRINSNTGPCSFRGQSVRHGNKLVINSNEQTCNECLCLVSMIAGALGKLEPTRGPTIARRAPISR